MLHRIVTFIEIKMLATDERNEKYPRMWCSSPCILKNTNFHEIHRRPLITIDFFIDGAQRAATRAVKRKAYRGHVTTSSGFIVCNSADRRASAGIYVAYGYLSPFRHG